MRMWLLSESACFKITIRIYYPPTCTPLIDSLIRALVAVTLYWFPSLYLGKFS
jgi:hypothetical protein